MKFLPGQLRQVCLSGYKLWASENCSAADRLSLEFGDLLLVIRSSTETDIRVHVICRGQLGFVRKDCCLRVVS